MFQDYDIVFGEVFETPYPNNEDLAFLVESAKDSEASPSRRKLVICDPKVPKRKALFFKETFMAIPVSLVYILDCISTMQNLPLDDYMLA